MIYEGNNKAWYLLIIIQTDIMFRLRRQCNDNVHESWKTLLDECEVSY